MIADVTVITQLCHNHIPKVFSHSLLPSNWSLCVKLIRVYIFSYLLQFYPHDASASYTDEVKMITRPIKLKFSVKNFY